jgi:predicted secreted Zn-dependent protease
VRNAQRPSVTWRKSSASDSGNCVEVAIKAGVILLRDSKDPAGPVLTFTESEWAAFLVGVRNGEFDTR